MALSDNLISYWSLDEASGNALDAHGSNDLTDNGSVGSVTGKVGNARDFELGSSQFFSHTDNANLSTGDIDFTITCWVYLESKPSTEANIVTKRSSDVTSLEYFLRWLQGSDRFDFQVSSDGGVGGLSGISANSFGAPSLSTWYFIAVWHDSAANTINIQVNNGTVDNTSHSGGVFNGSANFQIGNAYGGPFSWDGLIDEVGFWKRVLTSDERTDLYNGGAGRDYAYIAGGAPGSVTPSVGAALLAGIAGRMDLGLKTQTTLKI